MKKCWNCLDPLPEGSVEVHCKACADKMKEEEIKAQVGEQDLNMEIVEDRVIDHAFKFTPNEEESAKINKEFEETEESQTEA
jgi:hypothetical protein